MNQVAEIMLGVLLACMVVSAVLYALIKYGVIPPRQVQRARMSIIDKIGRDRLDAVRISVLDAVGDLFAVKPKAILKLSASLFVGALIAWFVINISAQPGIEVSNTEEAEGPQFANTTTLDIVSTVKRNRVCPTRTTRYVWRWEDYDGERVQHAIPLMETNAPFLAEDGKVIITIPSSQVPDPENGGWKYRTVTVESCGFLPSFIGRYFGERMFRSKDTPVTFDGNVRRAIP